MQVGVRGLPAPCDAAGTGETQGNSAKKDIEQGLGKFIGDHRFEA